MDYGKGLKEAIVIVAIVCFLGGMAIIYITDMALGYYGYNDLESSKQIIPIKKLVINNNKVDTIYIYKKP